MSTKSWLFLQNLSFKLKHDVLARNHFSSWLQSTLSCFQIVFEMPLNIDQPLESVCLMAMMTLSRAIICPIWVLFAIMGDGERHTSYLSQTPQTCLCKNFLSGVNFSRMSEKMHIYDFFRDIFSVFGDFSRFFGCKIWFSKILSV